VPPSRQRKASRQDHIADHLRGQIISGKFAAGQRLPTRQVLQRRFAASITTVQRALDELADGGFVVARGTLGTFVVEFPPHLHHYALVLFQRLGRSVRFLTTLANEAAAIGAGPAPRITIFHGVENHPDNEPHRQLLAAARAKELAGLILVVQPWSLEGSPLLEMAGLPRVAIAPLPIPNWDTVSLDEDGFLAKALAHFRAHGRKRLAVIAGGMQYMKPAALTAAAAASGLSLRPYWLLRLSPNDPANARECAHLLFHTGQDERPDALLISDDNLVEYSLLGLLDAGVRIPQDLEIVSHCNYPAMTPSAVPITRLGYDARLILTTAMSALDRMRSGKTPGNLLVPAEFEQEVGERTGGKAGG
jgi:DNA-binding LacI/PurR family transcriptional regulator